MSENVNPTGSRPPKAKMAESQYRREVVEYSAQKSKVTQKATKHGYGGARVDQYMVKNRSEIACDAVYPAITWNRYSNTLVPVSLEECAQR
jgi:hypothetical protein